MEDEGHIHTVFALNSAASRPTMLSAVRSKVRNCLPSVTTLGVADEAVVVLIIHGVRVPSKLSIHFAYGNGTRTRIGNKTSDRVEEIFLLSSSTIPTITSTYHAAKVLSNFQCRTIDPPAYELLLLSG